MVTTTRVTHATPAATYANTPHRDWEANVPSDQGPCKDIARQLVEEYPDIRVSGYSDGDDDDDVVVVVVTVVVVVISNTPHRDWEANVPSDQGPCKDIARQLVEEYPDIRVSGYSDGDDDDDVVVVVTVVVVVISNTPAPRLGGQRAQRPGSLQRHRQTAGG